MSRPVDRVMPEVIGFRYPRQEALIRGRCARCGRDVEVDMLMPLDRKEYGISALCPRCFDRIAEDWEAGGSEADDGA